MTSGTGASSMTIYVYDAMGNEAAEYSSTPQNNNCTTCYLSWDHLGSTRMITDQSGNLIARHDYMPFGEEVLSGTAGRGTSFGGVDTLTKKFTGKERDTESGLDYFGARYYGSGLGRWTSPDWSDKVEPIPFAKLEDPQSLNLYAYVRNSPISRTDPDGHCDTPTGLKPGQVGVCVASFIKKSFFWGVGRGDGRDANAHGGTSRIETRLIVDPATGTVRKTNETINRSGILVKDVRPQGVGGSTVSKPTTDKQGDTHFQVSQDAHSSYAAGGLIFGSIDNHVNLNVTPDGKVGIDQGSSARDFPSLEVFRYTVDDKGNVSSEQILYKQESGNVGDLKQPERPIAPEDPR